MAEQKSNAKLVVVTGASGFIAGHIVKELLERGYRVCGTVRSLENASVKYKYLYELDRGNLLKLVSADLSQPEEKWVAIIADADFVIHTLNPMPQFGKKLAGDVHAAFSGVAVPAMTRILNACGKNKKLIKFIYTSSLDAMGATAPAKVSIVHEITPSSWTNVNAPHIGAYAKSKTLAEQQIWDYVKQHEKDLNWSVVSVNPGVVFGPLLTNRASASVELIRMMLMNEMAFVAPAQCTCVDVRDVACIHVNAMENDKAKHKRYVAVAATPWLRDIAMMLKAYYGDKGFNISTQQGPGFLFHIMGITDSVVQYMIVPSMHRIQCVDNTQTVKDLGIAFRPVHETLCDTADSLIEHQLAHKKSKESVKTTMAQIGIGIAVAAGIGYFLYKKHWIRIPE